MTEGPQEIERLTRNYLVALGRDLRVHIASISGFSEMLLSGREGSLTEKQKKYAQYVLRGAQGLKFLVSDIWYLGDLDAGMTKFEPKEFDLRALTREVTEYLGERAKHCKKGFRLNAGDSMRVWANPDSIHIVLVNLLSVSLNLTPEGGIITVEISTEQPPNHALVKVSHTGPGMPGEVLDKIFNVSFVVQETDAQTMNRRNGLALPRCKTILEAQGGRIWAQNPDGSGAAFFFTLPFKA
jgi:K+-sensing histidine kinase KdpD